MPIQANTTIFLTGAGFTHNFGTPLARNMWAEIFNNGHVQSHPRVRDLLLADTDFESVYHQVITGAYSDIEKTAMTDALGSAYERLDSIVRSWVFHRDAAHPVNIYAIQDLIDKFSKGAAKGFFFTLNQDLFVERHYNNGARLTLPCIPSKQDWFSTHFRGALGPADCCVVPAAAELDGRRRDWLSSGEFFYVKLHGSQNWRSSDGSQRMVIGRQKEAQISGEPLLAWYFDVFREVLHQADRRLLVIGYGFADGHINEVIADGIVDHGLGVYVVSPVAPAAFRELLLAAPRGGDIFSGLRGYFPHTLLQLFPGDQSKTQAAATLHDHFFKG